MILAFQSKSKLIYIDMSDTDVVTGTVEWLVFIS